MNASVSTIRDTKKLMLPSVLVVILNYGTFDLTIKLIEELRVCMEYANFSIMVVDNYSPNESAEILKEKSAEMGFIFFANKTNAGYAAGNNIGIRYGIEHGFAYIWILNNDVELREKNILMNMVLKAEGNLRIGCVGPKIYTLDGTICAPYCRRPTFWSMTVGIALEKKYRQQYINSSREVYRVYGCCMLLKSKAMIDVDCMDERTFLYGEEDILAERMLAKRYISYYDAEVSVTHKESSSMKRMISDRKRLQIRETRKSNELYLKEYRKYPIFARYLCHLTRSLISYIR
jgi:GT2 family glycosyltransferase